MKIAVLDRATLGDDLSLSMLDRFGVVRIYGMTAPDEVAERIADCEVVIVNKIKLNENNLKKAKALSLICITATGYDNVDCAYCKARGIAVCNVVGYSTQSVAQLTVAMALYLWHHLPSYTEYVRNGGYTDSGIANRLIPTYRETNGKTWGIIGYGNIGKRVAQMAAALGFTVIVHSRSPKDGVENVDVESLCRRADVISLHTPLNDGTKHIINRDMIQLMKADAIIVNVARGGVWDEKAVAEAVLSQKIGGIASDVYTVEPFPSDHPFCSLHTCENVCLTPHMAWGAYEARERLMQEVADNIASFSAGGMRNRIV